MAEVLYLGEDDRIVKILSSFFLDSKKNTGEHNTVSHLKTDQQLHDALVGMVFELIIIEHKILSLPAKDYLDSFRVRYPSYRGKIMLAGDELGAAALMRILEAGWSDYIVMPPDPSLLVEKTFLYLHGKRPKDKQFYSLSLAREASIAKPGVIEEISEIDCRIRSTVAFSVDELSLLYSTVLGENGEKLGSAIGRCYKSEPHPESEGSFANYFQFVGVSSAVLQNIRNCLRKSYISNKK